MRGHCATMPTEDGLKLRLGSAVLGGPCRGDLAHAVGRSLNAGGGIGRRRRWRCVGLAFGRLASQSKCLAQNNKSCTVGEATKKR